MSDLIDRQAILKHIEKIRHGVQMMDDTHRASIIMTGMHLCEEAVRNQPSAQPEVTEEAVKDYCHKRCLTVLTNGYFHELTSVQPERKKGRWYKPKEFPRDSYRYICDNCQDVAYYVTGNNGKKNKETHPQCGYRYCPNCGAEMKNE